MRKAKPAPKIEALHSSFAQQWVTETREYEVITFFMGGGVEPYEADPITTIRAAEIKGLLRYWWRAIRGGTSNGSLAEMREREAEIWGWSGMEIEKDGEKKRLGQSKVHVEVEIVDEGRFEEFDRDEQGQIRTRWNRRKHREEQIRLGDPQSKFGYVAFPLRDRSGAGVWGGVRFNLHIRYPQEYQDEVEDALWAWETFGGVGARTRRGFGALKRIDNNASYPGRSQVESWVRGKMLQGHCPDGIPHLEPQIPLAITDFSEDALQVWQRLIRCLKNFRQARYPGRQRNRPGRSKWPEPDEIRRLWEQQNQPRKPLAHTPVHPVSKFPRGQMGLPIVFHFKLDREERKNFVEPPDISLQGDQHDRWTSRLILKPLPCQDGFVGLVAVLAGPNQPPGGWKLTQGVNQWVDAKLEPHEAQQIEPLHRLGNVTDVLQAFMKFVSERNCQW